MLVLEFKTKGRATQYAAIDEAIRTAQFVRNKCVRFWMDNRGVGQKELYRHSTVLREKFSFVKTLNSSACQASVERAYSSIARFYDNCKKAVPGKKGYPQFNCGAIVKKSLSMRTHCCKCGFVLDRDWNAALNILKSALSTVGHTGTWILAPSASGDSTSTLIGAILSEQVKSNGTYLRKMGKVLLSRLG